MSVDANTISLSFPEEFSVGWLDGHGQAIGTIEIPKPAAGMTLKLGLIEAGLAALDRIEGSEHIGSLGLPYIPPGGLGALAKCFPNVRWLSVLSLSPPRTLEGIEHFGNLYALSLAGKYLDQSLMESSSIGTVKRLSLSGFTSDEAMEHLAQFGDLEDITVNCTDTGLRALSKLGKLRSLTVISGISRHGLSALRDLPHLAIMNFYEALTQEEIQCQTEYAAIESLKLNGPGQSIAELAPIRDCAKISTLSINTENLDDEAIWMLKSFAHLRKLVLRGPQITPAQLFDLRESMPNCQLEHLGRSIITLPNAGAWADVELHGRIYDKYKTDPWTPLARSTTELPPAAGNVETYNIPAEMEVSLHGAAITSGVIESLGMARGVELNQFTVTFSLLDADVAAEMYSLVRLRTIEATRCEVSRQFLAAIATLPLLQKLVLDFSTFHDLRPLEKSRVTELHLRGTTLEDAGLQSIPPIESLRSLNIEGTRVTDDGAEKFRAAYPGVELVR